MLIIVNPERLASVCVCVWWDVDSWQACALQLLNKPDTHSYTLTHTHYALTPHTEGQ